MFIQNDYQISTNSIQAPLSGATLHQHYEINT